LEIVGVTVVWIEVEIWVISKGGAKEGAERRDGVGEEVWGYRVLGLLYMLEYSSAVIVKGACVRDCREMGFCMFGTVG
jgi:hypothetical protein